MSTPSARRAAPARSSLMADLRASRRAWLQNGVAALAISALGLGVAGAVMVTGSSHATTATTEPQAVLALPSEAAQSDAAEPAVDDADAKLKAQADQRAESLEKAQDQAQQVSESKAAKLRARSLELNTKSTREQAEKLVQARTTAAAGTSGTQAPAPVPAAPVVTLDTTTDQGKEKSCLPVVGGYTIAARFGDVGAWARYHTGFDFSDPVGTPLQAPAAGVVTNAGPGPASGWAGNYVAIQYPDGTQTLMAHMSTVSVQAGQTVSACQNVGAIGMTGRTFGPHVHFEVYPPGTTPGDVYKAVNPLPWLNAHGLTP